MTKGIVTLTLYCTKQLNTSLMTAKHKCIPTPDQNTFCTLVSWPVLWKYYIVSGVRPSSASPHSFSYTPRECYLYCCTVLKHADWRRLDFFHMQCEWNILHISWHDFLSNHEMLCHTGWFDVAFIISKQRLGLTSTYCTCKSDPQNLYQDERRWASITGVETCLWSTRHDQEPPDLPRHGCHSDWGTPADVRQNVLAWSQRWKALAKRLA